MSISSGYTGPWLLQELAIYSIVFFFPVGAIVLGRRLRELTGFARVISVIVVVLGVICAPVVAVILFGIVLAAAGAVADVIEYGNINPADRRAFIDLMLVAVGIVAVLQFTRRKRFVIFTAPK